MSTSEFTHDNEVTRLYDSNRPGIATMRPSRIEVEAWGTTDSGLRSIIVKLMWLTRRVLKRIATKRSSRHPTAQLYKWFQNLLPLGANADR